MKNIIVLTLFLPLFAHALVDMRNANFSDTWTDIELPGDGYRVKVQRTYNSRSLFNGMFGFGWCSNFESKLNVSADGTIQVTECGSGLQMTYIPRNFKQKTTAAAITTILQKLKTKNPSLTAKYLKNLKGQLSLDANLREKFANQLNIKSKARSGLTYYAYNRANESVVLKGSFYVRTLPDGSFEKYDLRGLLAFVYDKSGNYVKIVRKNKKITALVDNAGGRLSFKYHTNGKVKEILGPNKLVSKYSYKGENLVLNKNAWKSTFKHAYDELHNLTKITFPDGTNKQLTYNSKKDWVVSFKNRKGCVEKYSYTSNKKDPMNHYWSKVVKTCKKVVTNESTYEFIYKKHTNGSRYLYRTNTNNNSRISSVIYHEVFGKPVIIHKNGQRVKYTYYKNGLLKSRMDRTRTLQFSYKNKCLKTSKVIAQYYSITKKSRKTASKRKATRTITTNFQYDPKICKVRYAYNSLGQKVYLTYDRKGLIKTMRDQAKKTVKITYDPRFSQPSKIERPGLGSITLSYKKDGTVDKMDSTEGARIANQVLQVFSNLTEVIAPALSNDLI